MSTMRTLVERVFRDYLTLPHDQPTTTVLDGTLAVGITTGTVDVSMLTVEELDLFSPGQQIEVDVELVRLRTFDPDTGDFTCIRSQSLSHADGVEVRLPSTSRQTVFDAAADAVSDLYPQMWTTVTDLVVAFAEHTPVDVDGVFELQRVVDDAGVDVTAQFGFTTTSYLAGGPALVVPYGMTGRIFTVTWRTRIPRPTSWDDDLADLGIDPGWEKLLVVMAASDSFRGYESDRLMVEFLTEAVEAQSTRLGMPTDVATALMRYQEFLMQRKIRAMQADHPVTVIQRPAF